VLIMMRSPLLACVALLGVNNALAADIAAGKTVADRQCLECHEAADWEGEDAASLSSLIHDIVAGKVKHKRPLQLSESDIANIAAYWARGGK
jgi:mono/diheme cytochrome c family protein